MAFNRIRDFYDDHLTPRELPPPAADDAETREMVNVKLGDMAPALTEAFTARPFWIHDFLDDEILIPADLHQILVAYLQFRRRRA